MGKREPISELPAGPELDYWIAVLEREGAGAFGNIYRKPAAELYAVSGGDTPPPCSRSVDAAMTLYNVAAMFGIGAALHIERDAAGAWRVKVRYCDSFEYVKGEADTLALALCRAWIDYIFTTYSDYLADE